MAASFSLGDAVLTLVGNVAPLNKALGDAERLVNSRMGNITSLLSRTASGFQNMSNHVTNLASTLVRYGTIGGGAVLGMVGLAVKASSDFESAFAKVKRTVDASEEDFGKLRKGIVDMTEVLPKSASELSDIMQIAGQMGITGVENLLKFTDTIAKISMVTNLSAEEAASTLGKFITVSGSGIETIDRLGSAVNSVGQASNSSEVEIVAMMQRVVAMGSSANMTDAQMVALSAALTDVGVRSEMGGTAVGRLISDLSTMAATGGVAKDATEKGAKAQEEFAKWAQIAGMKTQDFARLIQTDMYAALQTLFQGLGRNQEAGANLFATMGDLGVDQTRLRETMLLLANASGIMADRLNTSNTAYTENVSLTKESDEISKTFAAQLVISKNVFSEFLRGFGDPIMSVFTDFLRQNVIPTFKALAGFVQENQSAIRAWVVDAVNYAIIKCTELWTWLDKNKTAIYDFAVGVVNFIKEWGPFVLKLSAGIVILAPVLSVLASVFTIFQTVAALFIAAAAPTAAFGTAIAGAGSLFVAGGAGALLLWGVSGLAETILKLHQRAPDATNSVSRLFDKMLGFVPGLKELKDILFDIINAAVEAKDAIGRALAKAAGNLFPGGKAVLDAINAAQNIKKAVGHNAAGTDNWRGGPTWVGERGPELLNLPKGAQVMSNRDSMRLAGSTGGVNINGPVTVVVDKNQSVAEGWRQFQRILDYGASRAGA